MILIQDVCKESSWRQRSDVRTQYSQPYRSTVKADALRSWNFYWSDAGDFQTRSNFPTALHVFPFRQVKSSPVDTMDEARNWKSSTFAISSLSSWRLECGILQVISLVFVVSMHRPTSSAVRQSKSIGLWAFSKDSSNFTMSSTKSRSLISSAGCRRDRRGTIVKPSSLFSHSRSTQSKTVTNRKEA